MFNAEKDKILFDLVKPLPAATYEVEYEFRRVEDMLEFLAEGSDTSVDICPDFQRGHVWTPAQQQHYIENVMRGCVSRAGRTLQFNAPTWNQREPSGDLPNRVQCLDGLQRLTAVRQFMAGEVKPFGFRVDELSDTRFRVGPGRDYRFCLAVYTYQTYEAVLEHYLAINGGGTPHSEKELHRVSLLLRDERGPAQLWEQAPDVYAAPGGETIIQQSQNAADYPGMWVLKSPSGCILDFDQYRHDLMERNLFRPPYLNK